MADNEKSGVEIFESPENLKSEFSKFEHLLVKNKKVLTALGIGVLAGVAVFLGFNYWKNTQNAEGQAALAPSVFAYESDSLNKALKGTAASQGLLAVADDYSSTAAGNLAHFYSGVALLKQGKFDDAIEHLKSFSSSDLVLQARAYSLIADAYSEKKAYSEAIEYYNKAVDYKPNDQFTPIYMGKLAVVLEATKDITGAIETLKKLGEKYPNSPSANMSKRTLARLEAQL